MAIENSDGSIVLSLKISTQKAIGKLKGELAKIAEGKNAFSVLSDRAKQYQGRIKELEKEYSLLLANEEKFASDPSFASKLKDLQERIKYNKQSLNETTSAIGMLGKKAKKSFSDMSASAKKFGKRIAGIVKSALIFSVLYRVMQGVVKLFNNILMSNEQFREDWEELKAAFYTAAYPIINLIVPAIKYIVQQVRDWAVSIGKVAAALQGMSYSELVDQAKSSKEAADNYANMEKSSKKTADNVKKQLASFDDIQILSSGNEEEQGAGLAGFEVLGQYDNSGEKSMLEDLMTAIGGALAAVGLILLFKGKIGWGVGFLVAGAAFWAITEFAEGEFSTDPVENALIKIMGILGTALAAVGILLCIFGGPAALPWGIGFIIAGAVAFVSAAAISSDAVVESIRGPIGVIMAIAGAALLVLGIILTCTGNLILGIPLIVLGAAALVTPIALNADAIVHWISSVWDSVKAFWNKYIAPVFTAKFWLDLAKNCGNGLISGFENAINGIISLFERMINFVVDGINSIGFDIPDWLGGGRFGFNIPRVSFGRVSIPRLAQGAVIPPNREFLAVLGDQKQGVNIEAPLQTIVDAFNIALQGNANYGGGNTEVVLEIDGREFGRAVIEQGNREKRRIGTRLVIV